MIKSMTGYGKGEAELGTGKMTVEIRTLNGKGADIGIKTQLLPKDKELIVRQMLSDRLHRGVIDLYITYETNAVSSARRINSALALEYFKQMAEIGNKVGLKPDFSCMDTILRFPDVMDNCRQDIVTEDNWPEVEKAVSCAIDRCDEYRSREGEALLRDVSGRIRNILDLEDEVERLEPGRVQAIRDRIEKAIRELSLKPDQSRFEEEMIYYLEKLDINEEKVRLRQHCKYFMDTIGSEEFPGKKLGFIIQEMGREINTTGSKANDVGIQKAVVRMKDELEKIREQAMNIL